jgi:hypothetical protein
MYVCMYECGNIHTSRNIQFHKIQLTHSWKIKTQPTKDAPIQRF